MTRRASLALIAGELDEKGAEKAFTRWTNDVLRRAGVEREVSDLAADFCDGVALCLLLEALTGQKIQFHRQPANKATRTENVHLALELLEYRLNFKPYGLNVVDIETGNKKVLLGLLFQLATRFQVNRALGLVEGSTEASAKQKLLRWCKEVTAYNPLVNVSNFDSSFQDGLVLCTILDAFLPNKIALNQLARDNALFNLNLALDLATAEGRVPRLLDAEDIAQAKKADENVLMIYVSFYYQWLAGRAQAKTEGEHAPVPLETPAQRALWAEIVALKPKMTAAELARLLTAVAQGPTGELADAKLEAAKAKAQATIAQAKADGAERTANQLREQLESAQREIAALKEQLVSATTGLASAGAGLASARTSVALASAPPRPDRSSLGVVPVAALMAAASDGKGSRPVSVVQADQVGSSKRQSMLQRPGLAADVLQMLGTTGTSSAHPSPTAKDPFIVADPVASSGDDESDNDDGNEYGDRCETVQNLRRKRVERVVSMIQTDAVPVQRMKSAPFRSGAAGAVASLTDASTESAADAAPVPQRTTSTTLRRHFSTLKDQAPVTLRRESTLPDVVKQTSSFRLEDGTNYPWWLNASNVSAPLPKDATELDPLLLQPLLENPEYDTSWYAKYFASREHHVFLCEHAELGSFVLTAVREDVNEIPTGVLCMSTPYTQVRVMVWLKTGIEKATIPLTADRPSLSVAEILAEVCPWLVKGLADVKTSVEAKLPERLIQIEEIQASRNFKFGVLYVREGQTKEEEMFSNVNGSPAFDAFLSAIGQKIPLEGWDKFRGGLDTKNGKTGEHSVFTDYCGYEIMFHVSTLLPYSASDAQQLERKRHIGNDIVTIVFQDEPGVRFSPLTITSHFLHVFLVVERLGVVDGAPQYRLNVCTNDKVPAYGPQLPFPAIWSSADAFRQFLLAKMINAEKAAYKAPAFMARRKRTLLALLIQIQERFLSDAKKGVAQRRLNQEAQENRRGDGTGAEDGDDRRWLLRTEVPQTAREVLCGAVWENQLLLGTPAGLAIASSDGYEDLPVAKARQCTQLRVVDDMGIAITLECRPGGHPYLFVYDLAAVERGEAQSTKLEETKNVTAFDVRVLDETPSGELLLLYVVKRQLVLCVWQPTRSSFAKLKEFTLPDQPTILRFVGDDHVFAAVPSGFVRVSIKDGSVQQIPLPSPPARVEPISIVVLGQEVLLSYNNLSCVVSTDGKQARDVVFKWSATPLHVDFLSPVVVGVTATQIEVRSLLNGNLLETRPCITAAVLCTRPSATPFASQLVVASPNQGAEEPSQQIMRLIYTTSAELATQPRLASSFAALRSAA
eukprot:Unigene3204_Nuclearia_a/m.9822 Unigene3204_Nuclearia_a/g.9822  ORF Unigene3204_Nuclearia_a/g.9822 Unigene3204_Nuclearia_a/m.9822 type:complete len:1313 (-) Unigene3204_Nuclearia_a:5-3943(-)